MNKKGKSTINPCSSLWFLLQMQYNWLLHAPAILTSCKWTLSSNCKPKLNPPSFSSFLLEVSLRSSWLEPCIKPPEWGYKDPEAEGSLIQDHMAAILQDNKVIQNGTAAYKRQEMCKEYRKRKAIRQRKTVDKNKTSQALQAVSWAEGHECACWLPFRMRNKLDYSHCGHFPKPLDLSPCEFPRCATGSFSY